MTGNHSRQSLSLIAENFIMISRTENAHIEYKTPSTSGLITVISHRLANGFLKI